MYELFISRQAIKDLEALPTNAVVKVTKAIEGLRMEPRPAGCKKLKGQREYLWRIRVGNYRIIYDIKDKIRVVEVREVGDRKEVYR
ncbi:MAG TPA: type II toxin-antitoxin system RelE/ParE family toxin [Flavobacteriales bacterium]|nr:type II toxin-antitoxin system RelE/ParE family toxin [Flavobacteriales bacterium]HQW86046.1 type II toxin-antitoxin system RelE/ParE family toxin [Flavobacteriales bacterium]